jgi:Predicted glycosyltransferases
VELFRLSVPDNAPEGCESLYYRMVRGNLTKVQNGYELSDNATVATDNYFNIFSSSKYAEYTKAENITFTTRVSGKMDVCLHVCTSEKDDIIKQVPVDSEMPVNVSLEFNINGLSDKENITCHYISFESKGTSKIHEFGSYSIQAEQSDVRLAIVICTFNREEYVNKTIAALKNMISDPSYDSKQIDVFIIDNGRTLTEEICSEPYIHLIPNRNLGGSGGFARGMIEACEHNATHILLMDDDIVLDPNAIYKTLNILRILKEEHKNAFLLGGMLDSDEPTMQFEAGSMYDGRFTRRKGGLDLTSRKSLMFNDLFEKTDYGAWWYMCMPAHICNNNLPLPFFIKMDDVEYGLRNMKDHIVMNGIGIWHESFEGKRNRITENYYHERNFRIIMSIYELKNYHFINFWHKVLFHLSSMDLEAIDLYIKGIQDYTLGPNFVSNINEEELHAEIQKVSTAPYNAPQYPLKSLARNFLKADFWRAILKCSFTRTKEIGKRKRVSKDYKEEWKNSTTTKYWKEQFKM